MLKCSAKLSSGFCQYFIKIDTSICNKKSKDTGFGETIILKVVLELYW